MPLVYSKSKDQILTQIIQSLQSNAGITATHPGAIARAFAEALAVEIGDLYEALKFAIDQASLSTAKGRALDLIGELYSVRRRTIAGEAEQDRASYNIEFFISYPQASDISIPKNTLVFGACYGDIPLPLIYEDVTNRLLNTPRPIQRKLRGSFVGTYTHTLRQKMFLSIGRNPNFKFETNDIWTNSVPHAAADTFIKTTLNSKYCLAPRGFGRSSFRFFEAMLLDTVPVYFWNDTEWLPYKDILDYSKFSVSIHESEVDKTAQILKSISHERYLSMLEELKRVRHYFTLEGMSEYIINKLKQ